jgi:hypothetical protein
MSGSFSFAKGFARIVWFASDLDYSTKRRNCDFVEQRAFGALVSLPEVAVVSQVVV